MLHPESYSLSTLTSCTFLLTEMPVDLKENAQCESYELSFIWGNMKTAAWETEPQIVLRDCSKDVWAKESVYVMLEKGEYMQSSKVIF